MNKVQFRRCIAMTLPVRIRKMRMSANTLIPKDGNLFTFSQPFLIRKIVRKCKGIWKTLRKFQEIQELFSANMGLA